MRYVAAYLLAVLGGNETPKAADLKAILESSGVGYDAEKASTVITKLAGKSVAEVFIILLIIFFVIFFYLSFSVIFAMTLMMILVIPVIKQVLRSTSA